MTNILGETSQSAFSGEGDPAIALFDQSNYFDELRTRIAGTVPGDRVALASMGFGPDEPKIAAVFDETLAAAERGVETYVGIDAYAFMMDESGEKGPLFTKGTLDTKMHPLYQERLDVLQAIGSATNGNIAITNQPKRRFPNPVAGRSHLKGAVVNDWTSTGGCNLHLSNRIDTMVGMEDPNAANVVYDIFTSVIKAGDTTEALGKEDKIYSLGENTDLLIDVGKKRQSIILESTFDMIDEAEDWIVLTCPFYPGGETGQRLGKAVKRGLDVYTLYNGISRMNIYEKVWQKAVVARAKRRLPAELFAGELNPDTLHMHAKLLLTEKGGEWGTHNLISAGVTLGTPEMTLRSYNPELAKQSARLIFNNLGLKIPDSLPLGQ